MLETSLAAGLIWVQNLLARENRPFDFAKVIMLIKYWTSRDN